MSDTIARAEQQLLDAVRGYQSCVVAFSGGVDSAVVAKAAQLALGERAVAATGIGPAVSADELATARRIADEIGIRHLELSTHEIHRPGYIANAPDRCYHCKSELYTVLGQYAVEASIGVVANGTNADDLGDYRPGLAAASEFQVRSPLVECGFDKQQVRDLARHWGLTIWHKPASPCLASRVAYGQQVTPERLAMIEQAEALLRELQLPVARVRYHEGDVARIEVPLDSLGLFAEGPIRTAVVDQFTQLGFRQVTLDLEGFRSGSLNAGLPLPLIDIAPQHP